MTTVESRRRPRRATSTELSVELAQWYARSNDARQRNGNSTPTQDHWVAFQAHLRKRRPRREPARLFAGDHAALGWCWQRSSTALETCERIARLAQGSPRKTSHADRCEAELRAWLIESTQPGDVTEFALSALAWTHALPHLAQLVPFELWSQLHSHLLATVAEAKLLKHNPLILQLLTIELPLTLAYVLPELDSCLTLSGPARDTLISGLSAVLDPAGMPSSRFLDRLRPLWAGMTRSFLLVDGLQMATLPAGASEHYAKLLANVLRLTRRDGSPTFAKSAQPALPPQLLKLGLRIAGDRSLRRAAEMVLPKRTDNSKQRPQPPSPSPSVHAEASTMAVLRSDWTAHPFPWPYENLCSSSSVRVAPPSGRDRGGRERWLQCCCPMTNSNRSAGQLTRTSPT